MFLFLKRSGFFGFLCCLFIGGPAAAQRFSYLYIQGDKQHAFYVRYAGEMLPRYSKNYTIIPQLGSGPMQIEILFQQNEYPPLTFNIQIPDNSSRGFLLTRYENSFALYDIQQRFYLMPGPAGEDRLPEVTAATQPSRSAIPSNTGTPPPEKELIFMEGIELEPRSAIRPPAPKEKKIEVSEEAVPTELPGNTSWQEEIPAAETPQESRHTTAETAVPEDVIAAERAYFLRRQREAAEETEVPEQPVIEYTTTPEPVTEIQETQEESFTPMTDEPEEVWTNSAAQPILNSDCPEPVSDQAYSQLFNAAQSRSAEDKKILYLVKISEKNCFTTRQAFLLARQLRAESMRYSFLKKVYPRITDQQNFPVLEDALFRTLEWKSYFRLIHQQ